MAARAAHLPLVTIPHATSAGNSSRQPVLGPFGTRREAEEELASALARIGGGGTAPDRSLRVGDYLDSYLEGKRT